jgi:hypothetical protein
MAEAPAWSARHGSGFQLPFVAADTRRHIVSPTLTYLVRIVRRAA